MDDVWGYPHDFGNHHIAAHNQTGPNAPTKPSVSRQCLDAVGVNHV